MARERQYGVTLNGWARLIDALEKNAVDFENLESYRVRLAEMLDFALAAAAEQAAMAAGKQEATKRLQGLLTEGRKLATFLRTGVRRQYGDSAEKLVEFDLQPFRSRPRTREETAPPVETPPPATE